MTQADDELLDPGADLPSAVGIEERGSQMHLSTVDRDAGVRRLADDVQLDQLAPFRRQRVIRLVETRAWPRHIGPELGPGDRPDPECVAHLDPEVAKRLAVADDLVRASRVGQAAAYQLQAIDPVDRVPV